jgi:hypothetical protein
MKFLFFFLGCYLLALSCLPCGDSNEQEIKEAITISETNEEQHDDCDETCTPFCACACCSVSPFFNPIGKIQVVKTILQQPQYFHAKETGLSEVLSSIWQPPKIAA